MANSTPSIEEMRQLVADADRAASEAGLALLEKTVSGAGWRGIKENLIELQKMYQHDTLSRIQLDGAITIFNNLEALPTQLRQRM